MNSNSKSEDTPIPEQFEHGLENPLELLDKPEPPQDTSLTEITAEYFMATDPDRVALQRKVLAWHKAEIKKLFDQIRSAIEGQEVDVEATREHMEELGASENEILNMEIEADDTKEILDGVREALTRLELSNNLKEGI